VTVGVGEILPLALVVTISPLNIIPAILLLSTARPLVAATTKDIVMAAAAAAAATIASGGGWRPARRSPSWVSPSRSPRSAC